MKNINLLNLSEEVQQAVLHTDANYRRHLGVGVDILEVNGSTVTVRVEQFKKPTEKVYEAKELNSLAADVLSHIPADHFKYRYRPLPYKGEGVEMVDAEWVKRRMKEGGVTQAQIVSDFASDKHVVSKLLSGKYGFTTAWKAAFWFYFK